MSIFITVEAYGELQSLCGGACQQIAVAGAQDVTNALAALAERFPQAQGQLAQTACAIGDELVPRHTVLQAGQTLVLIPPVSGG